MSMWSSWVGSKTEAFVVTTHITMHFTLLRQVVGKFVVLHCKSFLTLVNLMWILQTLSWSLFNTDTLITPAMQVHATFPENRSSYAYEVT